MYGSATYGQAAYGSQVTQAAVTPPPVDTTAPGFTGSTSVTNVTQTSAAVSYPAATDNVAVTGYERSLNGSPYESVGTALSFSLNGLMAGTAYNGNVRARDEAGNRSNAIPFSFTTQSAQVDPPQPGTIDATKVPTSRRVVFEGSKRVVSFEGSLRTVRF